MAEITKKEGDESRAKKAVRVEKGAIEGMDPEGFTPEEIARMLKVKQDIIGGRYTDVTPEHRKLLFVQWLIEHDKLGS